MPVSKTYGQTMVNSIGIFSLFNSDTNPTKFNQTNLNQFVT